MYPGTDKKTDENADIFGSLQVTRKVLLSHALAYRAIKKRNPTSLVRHCVPTLPI
jgi:hypothetical protein